MLRIWEIKGFIRDTINELCFFIIRKTNRYKDRNLSQNLFDIAEEYNTRPGKNNYYIKDNQ